MSTELRKLQVDLEEVALHMGNDFEMADMLGYFDTETGEAELFDRANIQIIEGIYEEYRDIDSDEPLDLDGILREQGYHDWECEVLLRVEQFYLAPSTRYVELPEQDSRAGYQDMEDFIEMVDDHRLRNRLERAIAGRGPFRRFKDVLMTNGYVEKQWFAFRDEREQGRVREWLLSIGIDAVNTRAKQ
ncbi:MAG: UPF0158 family protein [Chloroflexota bacterium]